jgi:hypothetical protein
MPPVCGYMGYVIPISPFKVFGDPAGPSPLGPLLKDKTETEES